MLDPAQQAQQYEAIVQLLNDRTAQLEAILAAIPAVVLVRDRNGVCTQILSSNNGAMARQANQMLGRSIADFAPPETARKMIAAIRQALDLQKTVRVEYPLIIRGAALWFQATISPLNSNEALIVAIDNTEFKRQQNNSARSCHS